MLLNSFLVMRRPTSRAHRRPGEYGFKIVACRFRSASHARPEVEIERLQSLKLVKLCAPNVREKFSPAPLEGLSVRPKFFADRAAEVVPGR
jgi:hypothetical protein